MLRLQAIFSRREQPTSRSTKDLYADAVAITDIVGIDPDDAKGSDLRLQLVINKAVIAEVVTKYTLLDEILGEIIVQYFFDVEPQALHYGDYWKTEKFRLFVHHVLDEMYLLKKMQFVHAMKKLPSDVIDALQKINALRNALAHSFFPENRREFKNIGTVLSGGIDIHTPVEVKRFLEDADKAFRYLDARAHEPELGMDGLSS
jgi:hypothetical protein